MPNSPKNQAQSGLRGSSKEKLRQLKQVCYNGYGAVTFKFLQSAQIRRFFSGQKTPNPGEMIP